jgi:hypothetical protein
MYSRCIPNRANPSTPLRHGDGGKLFRNTFPKLDFKDVRRPAIEHWRSGDGAICGGDGPCINATRDWDNVRNGISGGSEIVETKIGRGEESVTSMPHRRYGVVVVVK